MWWAVGPCLWVSFVVRPYFMAIMHMKLAFSRLDQVDKRENLVHGRVAGWLDDFVGILHQAQI